MKVLVDSSVWSLALRRRDRTGNDSIVAELASLVEDGRVAIIGAVRQEVLSGIRDRAQFEALRDQLRSFPDAEITSEDHEEAASFYNRCRSEGVQGSNTDFLICVVAVRDGLAIFTTDEDFTRFASVLPIVLHGRYRQDEGGREP